MNQLKIGVNMPFIQRRNFLQAGAVVGVASAFPAWAAGSETVGAIRPPGKEFMGTLPHLMELAKLPGIGIGVVEDGKVTWQHYAGVAKTATGTQITAESLFPAASMGKQVFAYGVILLAQQGKVDLDRPLKEYLADGAPTGKWSEKITARHVLSHSSGLPNWRGDNDQELTPAFEPGTKFRYSGEGYYFLQRCVEHITGVGTEQWVQDQVMKPVGMKSSTYLWSASADTRIVSGHRGGGEAFDNTEFAKKLFGLIEASGKPLGSWHHEEIVAAMVKDKPPGTKLMPNEISPNVAFSLLTTVADYSAFLAQVVSRQNGFTPVMRAAISTPISRINSALGWGLGFGIEQEGSQPRYLWQWGDNGGWKNFFLARPENQSAIVVFTNGERGMRVVERVVRAATGSEQAAFLWI